MRRAMLVTGGAAAALALLLIAAVVAILASAPGHAVARRLAVSALRRAVDGRVTIGSLGGSLWRAAELRDVQLAMPDGRPVIRVASVRVSFALADLVRRRFVISHVELDRPTVVLEAGADGHLNIEHLFKLLQHGGGPPGQPRGGPPGRRPLVELRSVHLADGTLVVRGRADSAGDPALRRFSGINLDLRRLRVSDPDSTGVVADVRRLAVSVSDPAVRVEDAEGRVMVDGDSVRFDLARVALPGTAGAARGVVRWGEGARRSRATLDVAASLPRAALADFRWAVKDLPDAGGGRVTVHARLLAGGGSEWVFENADISSGRSRVRGSAAFAIGARGGVRFSRLDVDAEPLDPELLVPFLGPMPIAGLVAGHFDATGTPAALDLGEDLVFTDERAPGRPANHVAGSGLVSVGGAGGIVFHRFAVTSATLSLATIAQFAPSITLKGRLDLSGTLDGPWHDAAFAGLMRHEDGGPGVTAARGTVRLTLADTVRIDADVIADPLSLDDVSRSYPSIGLVGAVAGRIRVKGPVGALAIEATLSGPGGGIEGRGEVASHDADVEIRVGGRLDSLDLSGHLAGAPRTSLSGTWRVDVTVPSDEGADPLSGALAVALSRSRVAGVDLARSGVALRLTPERLLVDTAYLEQPGMDLVAYGALGRPGQPPGQLTFALDADTLSNLQPLFAWLRRAGAETPASQLQVRGSGHAHGRIVGTAEVWEAQGELVADSIDYGSVSAVNGRVRGTLRGGARGLGFALRASADTLAVAGLRYASVVATASGPLDSLRLHVDGAFALASSLQADLELGMDSAGWTVRVEKGTLTLLNRRWALLGAPRLALTREAVAVDSLELRSAGGGRVRVAGQLPLEGEGDITLVADSVPVADVYALVEADTTGVGGVLSAKVHLDGTATSPRIQAAASLAEGRFGDFRAPLVEGSADYARRRLAFHGGLWRGRQQVVTVSGSLPLDLALTSVEERELPDTLEIRLRADSVDLAVLDALTSLVRNVSGQLTADVAVRGTWREPQLAGAARVSDGAAGIPALGARYSQIEARLSLSGNTVAVDSASLRGGTGTMDVKGEVRFESLTRPVLDLKLTARGFAAFTQRDFAGLTGSGTLQLKGPLIGATLSGRLVVDAGFLAFADLVEKRIVNLDDPEFRAVVDSNLAGATGLGPSAQNIFLDSLRIQGLTVSMGPDVWLRSHEANIQLAGDFTVARDVENGVGRYRLDGTLRAVRGTYRLVVGPTAKEFRVTRGTVRFFGTPDLNPDLDIVAEHSVHAVQGNDVVVRAVISGTLLVPRLTLESDQRPPLSETEIVSYLLFGRPSFDLASGGGAPGSEQAILQGALVGLAGVVSGELEQTLVTDFGIPVDYLAIRPGGGSVGDIFGNARVEAGTQIGERTFLTLNAGLCQVVRGSQAFGANVQYRLAPRWTLEASIEPTVQECRPVGFQIRPPVPYQIGMDLFWQWGVP
jgi:translocation and assembly module TamB